MDDTTHDPKLYAVKQTIELIGMSIYPKDTTLELFYRDKQIKLVISHKEINPTFMRAVDLDMNKIANSPIPGIEFIHLIQPAMQDLADDLKDALAAANVPQIAPQDELEEDY